MNTKLTRRAVLGTVIGGLAVAPFVMWSLRHRALSLVPGYEEQRKRYLEEISFPREFGEKHCPYAADVNFPNPTQEECDEIYRIRERYWMNFARLRKAEFDYSCQGYEPDGSRRDSFWDMDVHISMEYGVGYTARGKDSTGYPVDLQCTPDGCHIASARHNAGVSNLMMSFFGALYARPHAREYWGFRGKGVSLPQNPYFSGNGRRYDVLFQPHDLTAPDHYSLDYFDSETGLRAFCCEYEPGNLRPKSRGRVLGNDGSGAECYTAIAYTDVLDGLFLPTSITTHASRTKYKRVEKYSNYANVVLQDS